MEKDLRYIYGKCPGCASLLVCPHGKNIGDKHKCPSCSNKYSLDSYWGTKCGCPSQGNFPEILNGRIVCIHCDSLFTYKDPSYDHKISLYHEDAVKEQPEVKVLNDHPELSSLEYFQKMMR